MSDIIDDLIKAELRRRAGGLVPRSRRHHVQPTDFEFHNDPTTARSLRSRWAFALEELDRATHKKD
jgi:hypothetical protein